LAFEYFYLVLIASIGVIQAAVAYSGFKGISFFRHKIFSYLFTILTLGPVLGAFFTWNERNLTGVIEGSEQFYLFMLAIVAAIGFTLFLSSLLNHRSIHKNNLQCNGFEALKEVTFYKALRYRYFQRR
jgi:hypothetical protein